MAEERADLHLHTYFSDGSESPEEVIFRAQEEGLSCVAITDHDAIDGIDRAVIAGQAAGIEVIPGIELSADLNGREIHILGYYIRFHEEWFAEKLSEVGTARIERMQEMLERLRRYGISLTLEDVLRGLMTKCPGRLHLAQALHHHGYVSSTGSAFKKYIGDGKPCYVSNFNFSPHEAVDIIHQAGGVSVLAHPYIFKDDRQIEELIACGIQGIEVYHSEHTPVMEERFLRLAKKHSLLITGGSDCHGLGKSRVLMGTVKIPMELVLLLKERAQERG